MATVADAARQGTPETPEERKRREAAAKAVQAHPDVKAAAKAVSKAADHPAVKEAQKLDAHPAVQEAKAIAASGRPLPPALAAHPQVQQAIAISNHPAVQAHAEAVAAPAHQAHLATSAAAHPAISKAKALESHPAVAAVKQLEAHPAVAAAKQLDKVPQVAQARALAASGRPIPPALAAHPAVAQAISLSSHPMVQQHAAAAAHPVAQAHANAVAQVPAHQSHLVTSTNAAGAPRGSNTGVRKMAISTSPTGKIVSMGVVQAAVAAGATADIRVRPQVHFAVTNFVVDPTLAPFFRVTGLNVGVKPQLAAAGEQPAGSYAPNATFQLSWDPCDTGTDIIVSVRNTDAAAHDFAATLIGHEHE